MAVVLFSREVARQRLDRPGGRLMLGLAAERLIRHRTGERCRVRHDNGGYWRYEYANGTLPLPMVTTWPTLGRMEAEAQALFFQEYVPTKGDVVIDVGAGVGSELLLMSRLVGPSGMVYAIEAHPGTYLWLARLAQLNALDNARLANVAIAAERGRVTIADGEVHEANSVIGVEVGIRVPALSIDDFVREQGISRIDFLKMNIEGAERLAVQGMDFAATVTRNVCVGCHDFLADCTGDEAMRTKGYVHRRLLDLGFEVVERRMDDARDFARGYLYGRRAAV